MDGWMADDSGGARRGFRAVQRGWTRGVGHLEEDVELVREESRSGSHALARVARSFATLADAIASKSNNTQSTDDTV